MDYFNDFWYGYITAEFVRRCVDESLENCHGCRDEKISSLLHKHHQLGLKDKLVYHMESVRGALIPLIPTLYEEFKLKIALKIGDTIMDKDAYLTNGRFFLISATPESLYFGRYLTETNVALTKALRLNEVDIGRGRYCATQCLRLKTR